MTSNMIAELLAQLGNTPKKIAENLRKSGVKGCTGHPLACPLANWLKKQTGAMKVHIGLTKVSVFCDGQEISERLPDDVFRFVTRFDAHEYPDLEA